jgi:hypothetical protein
MCVLFWCPPSKLRVICMAGLAELRRRFEEDKERIRRMKQGRRGADFN